jgi:transcriptional regulator with GAF, ATPase, and Fis domain
MIFRERMSHLVGKSPAMEALRKTVERTILHTGPVLIQGESGVGKDLVARAIACMYERFVTVNCSAIPDALFESELFGHTRGAFTGAQNERIGLFEEANGGAIFLDEIGDMSLPAQAKVLRALQENKIVRVGGEKEITVNVRILAATNKNLKSEIEKGNFREDLYHRLSVVVINVPPLRERKDDIPLLVTNFMEIIAQDMGKPVPTFEPEAMEALQQYQWTGNIRELHNIVERLAIFCGDTITKDDVVRFGNPLN